MAGDHAVGAGDGADPAVPRAGADGVALDVAERRGVDAGEVAVQRYLAGEREVAAGVEGSGVEVQLEVDVAATGDEAALNGRTVGDQAAEVGAGVVQVHGGGLLGNGPRFRDEG